MIEWLSHQLSTNHDVESLVRRVSTAPAQKLRPGRLKEGSGTRICVRAIKKNLDAAWRHFYSRRGTSDAGFRVSRIQMTKPLPPEVRLQSLGEEIANSLSSGIGLMAVIAGIPLLFGSAIQRRNEFSLSSRGWASPTANRSL
jgi:hypothetical protein